MALLILYFLLVVILLLDLLTMELIFIWGVRNDSIRVLASLGCYFLASYLVVMVFVVPVIY